MTLRSTGWAVGYDEVAMSHRMARRLAPENQGRPLIGIAHTTSALNLCHKAFPVRLAHVARGIRDAAGVTFRFPVTLAERQRLVAERQHCQRREPCDTGS